MVTETISGTVPPRSANASRIGLTVAPSLGRMSYGRPSSMPSSPGCSSQSRSSGMPSPSWSSLSPSLALGPAKCEVLSSASSCGLPSPSSSMSWQVFMPLPLPLPLPLPPGSQRRMTPVPGSVVHVISWPFVAVLSDEHPGASTPIGRRAIKENESVDRSCMTAPYCQRRATRKRREIAGLAMRRRIASSWLHNRLVRSPHAKELRRATGDGGGHGPAAGSVNQNVVPSPSLLRTPISPR